MSPSQPYFGGKGAPKIEWTPMPLMDTYLEALADTRTENYIESINRAFSHFARFCLKEDIRHPGELERKHLNRFDAYLRTEHTWQGRPVAASTRGQFLRAIKTWISWCSQHGHIPEDPWVMIKLIATKSKKVVPFQEEELNRIFEAHKKSAFMTTPFFYHRREVILALLYGWGLKPGELGGLTVTAMDNRLNEVLVKKANGVMKTMPYGDEMKGIIQRWVRVRGAKAKRGEDALLIDQEGFPITEKMVGKILKELGARAGVDLNSSRFRENFAATVVQQGAGIEHVSKMLGINMTKVRQVSREHDEELKESYDFIIDPLMGRYFGGKT